MGGSGAFLRRQRGSRHRGCRSAACGVEPGRRPRRAVLQYPRCRSTSLRSRQTRTIGGRQQSSRGGGVGRGGCGGGRGGGGGYGGGGPVMTSTGRRRCRNHQRQRTRLVRARAGSGGGCWRGDEPKLGKESWAVMGLFSSSTRPQ